MAQYSADAIFDHPKLAAIYDALDPDRGDLGLYLDVVKQKQAHKILDIGCGTGVFALLLADQGYEVVGVDPAAESLKVAQNKSGADLVRWVHGDATGLPPLEMDMAVMTGNVAQAIVDPKAWRDTLEGIRRALRLGGHLVFETRNPAAQAWRDWNREVSHTIANIPGVGEAENWVELVSVKLPLVTFRWTFIFVADGSVLTSDSTLRFRERFEIERDLAAHGFEVEGVRDAPDRPGREFVFIARRER